MEKLELKQLLEVIWNRKKLILIITSIFTIIGVIYSFFFTVPKYETYTSLVLVQENSDTSISQNDISVNQDLISTYSELIKSKTIIRKVKNNLQISEREEDIRENITVTSVKNTEMIQIIVHDENANNAMRIANEIARVFTEEIKNIYNINNVYIVDRAEVTQESYNINHIRDILVFILIGFLIGNLYVVLSNIIDNTVKNEDDIEKYVKSTIIGTLPEYDWNKNKGEKEVVKSELVTKNLPKIHVSEYFRTLRTNIQFMINNKSSKTILVTSTFVSEGKSWVSANLAITFTQIGKKVIIVDSDMRKGRQSKIFGLDNKKRFIWLFI